MSITLSGMITLVSSAQFWNACQWMDVTLLGMTTFVKPVQEQNAPVEIKVTLLGIFMIVSPVQPAKDQPPIVVTLPSSGIMLFLQPTINVLLEVSIKQLPLLWYALLFLSTVIHSKPVQPENVLDVLPDT